ncbi:PaaI family thioesterase [Amorphus coralli]|uniref:PaaI family thioesterase n=1 Tax=Amorphus coralli TaxID=340680 RepID=UPI00146DF1B8|nr:PaaI family thioesterase [Amorphus coralli]
MKPVSAPQSDGAPERPALQYEPQAGRMAGARENRTGEDSMQGAGEIAAFLAREFPAVFGPERGCVVDVAEAGRAVCRLVPTDDHLRPGDIVSGPTMMMLADATAYAALLSVYPGAIHAVTTNLSINFLRALKATHPIVAECEIIKPGKRLAVLTCEVRGKESDEPAAHVVMTYSLPPVTRDTVL